MKRLIVTGWRGATVEAHCAIIRAGLIEAAAEVMRSAFARELDELDTFPGSELTLAHGQCPYGGVDRIADDLARDWGWSIERYPPEIVKGRVLGPQRNRSMCEPGADLMIAFPGPGSRGTWDCLQWAQRYGIPFRGYPLAGSRRGLPSA